MSKINLGSCAAIAAVLGHDTRYCCSSCHEDEAEGYFDLGEKYENLADPDSDFVTVCCAAAEVLGDHPDPWPLLRAHRRAVLTNPTPEDEVAQP